MGDGRPPARGDRRLPGRALRPARSRRAARAGLRDRAEGLSRPRLIALARVGFRAAHAGLRVWWFVRRPHTQGVKCIIGDGERVIFVRHTYGNRRAWELPGGGVRRGEPPETTVRREMREELGVELDELRPAGAIEVGGHGKRTLLHCFAARASTTDLRLARAEIAEARWAPVTAPPRPLGPHAAAVLDLVRRA